MDQTTILTTIAQVAIGLAGFTGIASIFSNRGTGVAQEVQTERLRSMLETALVVVAFSFVPLFLQEFDLNGNTRWRLASALYSVAWISLYVITIRRGLSVLRNARSSSSLAWKIVVFAIGILSIICLLVGAAGYRSSTAYLGALLLQLCLCALYFYRFFLGTGGDQN